MKEFNKTETWTIKEKLFNVEVKHWVASWGEDGKNRWNVYIYLFPDFPNYDTFEDKIGANIPVSMNWGNTYSKFDYDKSRSLMNSRIDPNGFNSSNIRLLESYKALDIKKALWKHFDLQVIRKIVNDTINNRRTEPVNEDQTSEA